MVPIISVVGPSNCGKTTYLEQVVHELKLRGYRVAVVKHTLHDAGIDIPGTDTWRYSQAGADIVCLAAQRQLSVVYNVGQEVSLQQVLTRIDGVDLILTEGYKREPTTKIEFFRTGACVAPICRKSKPLAVISDTILYNDIPHFRLDDVAGMADFLAAQIAGGDDDDVTHRR